MIPLTSVFSAENNAFFRRLWHLAIPVSIQVMMYSLLGLVDIMMVGRLGETSVAAVGIGNRVFFFNMILIAALGNGMTVLASQFVGAGDKGGLRRTMAQATVISMLITLPFVILYLLFPSPILGMATSDTELLPLATVYLLITAPSILSTALVMPLEAGLRAASDTKAPTRIAFITIMVNVVLNYVFIFGALGIPAMGVAGSALGTTVARLIQPVILIYYIKYHRAFLIPSTTEIRQSLQKSKLWHYLSISLPIMLQDGLWAFGTVLYGIIFASMGVNELAVMSAITAIEAILMAMFIGFGIGCSIIISQELGASHYQTAWRQSWLVLAIAPLAALTIGIAIVLLRHDLVLLFGDFNDTTRLMASDVMMIAGLGLVLRVINFTGIIGILRSGGDVRATTYINVIGMWVVGLPLTFTAVYFWQWPLVLVFLCCLCEEVTKSVMVIARIVSRKWLRNLVSSDSTQPSAQH